MSKYNRDQCILSWSKSIEEKSGTTKEGFITMMHQLLSEEYTRGYADGIGSIEDKLAEQLVTIATLKAKLKARK